NGLGQVSRKLLAASFLFSLVERQFPLAEADGWRLVCCSNPAFRGEKVWKTPTWLLCWSVAALPATQRRGRRLSNSTTGASTTFAIGLQVQQAMRTTSRKRFLSRFIEP